MKNFTIKTLALCLLTCLAASTLIAQVQDRQLSITLKNVNKKQASVKKAPRPFVPCSFTEFEAYRRAKNPSVQSEIQFEQWLSGKLSRNIP